MKVQQELAQLAGKAQDKVQGNHTGLASAQGRLSGSEDKKSAADMKNEFLQLMVAQIHNQDPLNPMDGAQYLSQLAQLSTVEGVQKLASIQHKGNNVMDSLQVLQSTQLVGKNVSVPADHVSLDKPETLKGQIKLNAPCDELSVKLLDMNGKAVKSLNLGNQNKGEVPFSVADVPAGVFKLDVVATRQDQSEHIKPNLDRKVEKVSIPAKGGDIQLQVAGIGNRSLLDVNEFLGASA